MAQGIETTLARRSSSLRVPIRGMHWHLYADPGPQQEEALPTYKSGLLRDWDCLPQLSSDSGRKDEPRGDEECGSNGDPFADWQGVEPMTYPEGCDDPDARRWYSRGRTDKMLEMHEQMMPMVERVIEIASQI